MRLIKKWWPVLLIILFAVVVRTYKLASIPASLYYDEIDLGYQARSLIQTGKDYRGVLSPFFVRSFNTDKTPIPVYMSIPTTLIFKSPQLQVRVTTALIGALVVVLASLLVWMWTKSKLATAAVAFVFAFNPWLIHFSRIAFEAIYVLFFYLAFLIFFFRWIKQKKLRDYYLSIVFLCLGVYVYRIMSFYVPLTFLMVGVVFFKELWQLRWKHLILGGALAAVIVLPFLYATTIASADQTRIEQISITSDPLVPIYVLRNREVDSGDYKEQVIGKKALWSSYLFHNKPLSWMSALKNNYLKAFSTEYLFIEGDSNLRQGVSKMGELFLIDALGLMAGLWFVVKRIKDKKYQWLMVWFLTSPLAADLTIDGAHHASRLIMLAAPLLLIVGLGWWQIITSLSRYRFKWLIVSSVAAIWLMMFANYAHKYLVHFPLESAKSHGYGFEQAMKEIVKLDSKYKKVVMTESYDPPMLYYMFWANVPPKEIQEYGPEFGAEISKGKRLDKYKVISWSKVTEGYKIPEQIALAMETNTLYLVTPSDVKTDWRQVEPPKGVKIEKIIPFPDNAEVAFYLIARN